METIAYLSLGSNIGDRETYLRDAIGRLQRSGRVIAVSSIYETEPVEVTEQPWFLNCAVALATNLAPEVLLSELLAIEKESGRERRINKGPRIIDIDLLFYGDLIRDTAQLELPHPAMHRRRFVLEPLAEVAPDVVHPLLKKTIRELLQQLPCGQIVRKK